MNNKKINTVGIIVTTFRENTEEILNNVYNILDKHDITYTLIEYDISYYKSISEVSVMFCSVDMIISIGGDGTLLSALKIAIKCNTPVLPIYNGTLGFISEIPPDEAYTILEEYLSSDTNTSYKIEPRVLLHVSTIRNNVTKNYLAVNDMVISKNDGRVIHLDIKISDRVVSYLVADGVVVATPTGSTAYALSAGGPILAPQIDAMSFVAIAPHSLTFRPLVIPKEDNIELSLAKKNLKAMLTIDGYDICEVDSDTIIKTQISNKYCYIFQSSNRLFYDILRYKLNWGR